MAAHALFCSDPLDPRRVEPGFAHEVEAAREAGLKVALVDHDALDHRVDPDRALSRCGSLESGRAVYRGWMLRSEAFAALSTALGGRGVTLLTSPAAYEACHHAPGSHGALRDFMPRMVWVTADKLDDASAVEAALAGFHGAPVVIKDWVKSQAAGYWKEACFIPDTSDRETSARVIRRFRELQADSLVGGIVFKAYLPLRPVGAPPDEYRAFVVNRRVIGCWPRTPRAGQHQAPPEELLRSVAELIPSPFASADFGIDEDGRWWLLEVGDGQVSALPTPDAGGPLFEALARAL